MANICTFQNIIWSPPTCDTIALYIFFETHEMKKSVVLYFTLKGGFYFLYYSKNLKPKTYLVKCTAAVDHDKKICFNDSHQKNVVWKKETQQNSNLTKHFMHEIVYSNYYSGMDTSTPDFQQYLKIANTFWYESFTG